MSTRPSIFTTADVRREIQMIVAQLGAKSVISFVDDLLQKMVMDIMEGVELPAIPLVTDVRRENKVPIAYGGSEQIHYIHRIEAVRRGTNLHNWLASILTWLAEEHKANGRYWIDDTPARLLPIRTRRG